MKRETPFALAEMRSKLTSQHNRLTVLGIARRLMAHVEALDALIAKLGEPPELIACPHCRQPGGVQVGDMSWFCKKCRDEIAKADEPVDASQHIGGVSDG